MGTSIKRYHAPEFKVNVVLDLIKEEQTLNQICSKYSIHPTQARRWKEYSLAILTQSFNGKTVDDRITEKDQLINELYRQVGQLKVELDWLKKKIGCTP